VCNAQLNIKQPPLPTRARGSDGRRRGRAGGECAARMTYHTSQPAGGEYTGLERADATRRLDVRMAEVLGCEAEAEVREAEAEARAREAEAQLRGATPRDPRPGSHPGPLFRV
jgi:hypothetical protein